MNTYETERLILRPMAIEDAEFFLELVNTEKWLKFIGDRKVKDIEASENYIKERMYPQYEKGYYNYLIINKQTQEKMGSCGVYGRDFLEVPDIGFAFLPDFEGKGFAYEAAAKVKEIAIKNFGLTKISGITMEENHSSRKLLEKLGLKFQKKFFMEGDQEELMYYEWEM